MRLSTPSIDSKRIRRNDYMAWSEPGKGADDHRRLRRHDTDNLWHTIAELDPASELLDDSASAFDDISSVGTFTPQSRATSMAPSDVYPDIDSPVINHYPAYDASGARMNTLPTWEPTHNPADQSLNGCRSSLSTASTPTPLRMRNVANAYVAPPPRANPHNSRDDFPPSSPIPGTGSQLRPAITPRRSSKLSTPYSREVDGSSTASSSCRRQTPVPIPPPQGYPVPARSDKRGQWVLTSPPRRSERIASYSSRKPSRTGV